MHDNYFTCDLIDALQRDIIPERYYPLITYREELAETLRLAGAIRKEQVTDAVTEAVRIKLGDAAAKLFARYIRIFDFNRAKLREIKDRAGTEEYDALAGLMMLPGVRLLRAELYFNSGVTLATLAERSTAEIRDTVGAYIRRENRPEIVPQPKEVNCHRAVAKMLLRANGK